jgi:hypothetical protein
MSRKYEAIDLMKLYTHGSHKSWNEYLSLCLRKLDINALMKLRYQICAGMDDLAKQNLNDDKMNLWFVRLTRSIEQTAKKIITIRHPMPGDNTLLNSEFNTRKYLEAKRKRDVEFRKFMNDSAY